MQLKTSILVVLPALLSPNLPAQPSSLPRERAAIDARSSAVDEFVRAEMQKLCIPGLSLAILENGKIIKATGYGIAEKGGKDPVTANMLFQAGSISKPVAAPGAMRLVEQGKLVLDEDVNAKLVTSKVPENKFTKDKKVTLRGLLSHKAGLTVHGFPGYAADAPRPSVVQILNGEKPANTPAVRVDILPGSKWRYSGGGYTVMQQMIVDLTHKPFDQFMQETVLGPIGMNESTFAQPLPASLAKLTASGHLSDRSPVAGKWHIYPEMAAAGLWTTPSDLVRFAASVQLSLAKKSGLVLSQQTARLMLAPESEHYGLGFALQGDGRGRRFGHGGRDEGFDAQLVSCLESGQAAAIMININDNSGAVSRILDRIAREYGWPDNPPPSASRHTATVPPRDRLQTGKANTGLLIYVTGEGLVTDYDIVDD